MIARSSASTRNQHFKKCANFPIQCPNKYGVGVIQRESFNAHIKAHCPLQIESCVLEFAGCTIQTPRKDRKQHLAANTAMHITLLTGMCAEYKYKLDRRKSTSCKQLSKC